MLLIVRRDVFSPTTTLGRLSIVYDGPLAYTRTGWVPSTDRTPLDFGFCCEDEDRGLDASMPLAELRRLKVMSETAIPVGEYATRIRWWEKHQIDVIELLGVPGFAGIFIHSGNRERDTAGCLLPGLRRDPRALAVYSSSDATAWLLARAKECRDRGEAFRVRVERDPAAWAWAPLNPARLNGSPASP